MAGLTVKDFRGKHGDTRAITLIEKLIQGPRSLFITTDGKQQPFNKITYPDPRTGRVVTKNALDVSESTDIINVIKGGQVPFNLIKLSYERNSKIVGAVVSLNEILKTEEFGSKVNKGDMAEVIFSAAIVCRFLNKNQPVIDSDVLDMIKTLNDTDPKQILGPMKSPNKEPKVVDDLWWEVSTTLIAIRALQNPRHLKNLKSIISSSVKYANSTTVAENAKWVYENSLYNKIKVKAVGTVAQNDTKVDVYVEVDGKRVNINVSLKAGSVKQFGQVGGGTIDSQKDLWNLLADLKITPAIEKKYFDTLKTDGILAANSQVYISMATMFNNMMITNPNKVYDSISDGIMFFGTRNDDEVEMVQLNKREAMVYKFDNLKNLLKLKNKKLVAKYIPNKTKPEIRFQDNTGMVLITLRMKQESRNNYIRHYIEKGKLMTDLVGMVAA
jgi:hypothetical protein